MKFELKYKLILLKAYFDKGYGLTHYLFKVIAVFGLVSQKFSETFIMIAVYSIACFVLGILWYKYNWIEAEFEVSNRFNLFMKELRNNPVLNNNRNI